MIKLPKSRFHDNQTKAQRKPREPALRVPKGNPQSKPFEGHEIIATEDLAGNRSRQAYFPEPHQKPPEGVETILEYARWAKNGSDIASDEASAVFDYLTENPPQAEELQFGKFDSASGALLRVLESTPTIPTDFLCRLIIDFDKFATYHLHAVPSGMSDEDLGNYLKSAFDLTDHQSEQARLRVLEVVQAVKEAAPKWADREPGQDAISFYRQHWANRTGPVYLEDIERDDPALVIAVKDRCKNLNMRLKDGQTRFAYNKILPPRTPKNPAIEARRASDRKRQSAFRSRHSDPSVS